MSLQGQTVRIIIHKPENWDIGNLFGKIISDRGGRKLTIKLTNQVVSGRITSDILELQPLTEKETFKPLGQYYSVIVNGTLKCNETGKAEHIIYGSVTLD
ncbi:MAG: hypothetical protein QM727_12625 [Niabella sp.]